MKLKIENKKLILSLFLTTVIFISISISIALAQNEITIQDILGDKIVKYSNLQNVNFKIANNLLVKHIWFNQYTAKNGDTIFYTKNWMYTFTISNYTDYIIYRTFTVKGELIYYNNTNQQNTLTIQKDDYTILPAIRLQIEIYNYENKSYVDNHIGILTSNPLKINVSDSEILPISQKLNISSVDKFDLQLNVIDYSSYIKIQAASQLQGVFYWLYTLLQIVDHGNIILYILLFFQFLTGFIVFIIYYILTAPSLVIIIFEGFNLFYCVKTTNSRREALVKFVNINVEFTRKVLNLFKAIFDLILKTIRG